MSRPGLCARAVVRDSRRQRRVTALALALVAVAVADLVVALSWPIAMVTIGAWLLVVFVMAAAVVTTDTSRERSVVALSVSGAGPGTTRMLTAMQALFIGGLGSLAGIVLGVVSRVTIVGWGDVGEPEDIRAVLVGSFWCVVAALVVAVASVLVLMARRRGPRRQEPRLSRLTRLALSLAAISVGVGSVAQGSSTFRNFEISLFLFAPLIALGAVGLAGAVLSAIVTLLSGRGGVSWFVVRSLGNHRSRTVPVLAIVTITVGACAFAAILTSSLHERVEQAKTDLILQPEQDWTVGRGDIDLSGFCAGLTPEERERAVAGQLCPSNPTITTPRQLDPTDLAASSLALRDPSTEWRLLLVSLLVSFPLIVIAVGLDRAARADDDELLEIQGAAPSIRRRAAMVTAFLVTLAASLTGVLVAVLGTAAGFLIYNGHVRTAQEIVFPPVPFAAPPLLLLGFVLLVPLVSAGAAALLVPGQGLRARLGLAQRVEQPVSFA